MPGSLFDALDLHEKMFIETFLDVDRRKRWAEALLKRHRRNLFLTRLADSRDFIQGLKHSFNPCPKNTEDVLAQLKRFKIQNLCHIISQYDSIDGQKCDLADAVENVFGIGLGSVVSCVPGKVAYFEGEMPKDRCLLIAPKV